MQTVYLLTCAHALSTLMHMSGTSLRILLHQGAHDCLQVVLKLIQPYTRIRIPFVSQQLNIPEADVEQLLVSLILDNRINGHIDQVGAFGRMALHESNVAQGMRTGSSCFG